MAGVYVNLGCEQLSAPEVIDISGMEFFPIGLAVHLVDRGLVGYDKSRADSSLMSSRAFSYVYKYMTGDKCSPFLVNTYKGKKLNEVEINPFPGMCDVTIKGRLIGTMGRAVPPEQCAYLVSKLGKKYGFFLVNRKGEGGPDVEEHERDIDLSYFDAPEIDELELVR